MARKALITGITGQDGSYLAEYLLSKEYEVHGIIRRASTFNTSRIEHIYVDPHSKGAKLFLHYGDLSDPGVLTEIMYNIRPEEIYHLGAQSHVRVSFDLPEFTGNITGLGTTRLLEAVKRSGIPTRFYQASSSEMFGDAPPPQNEATAFLPRSPYAAAKVYSYWMAVNYREAYGCFVVNGILFNHESPRRGEIFVTRKITRAIASILSGRQDCLFLGNLDAKRDWGFAPEYVEAMWKMLQLEHPSDLVIGTGQSHSVREFLEFALSYVGLSIAWKGSGALETASVTSGATNVGKELALGSEIVRIDAKYYRPTEVSLLRADVRKAREHLQWEPRVTFEELVMIMMDYDLMAAGLPCPGVGVRALQEKGFGWTRHKQMTIHGIEA